MAKLNEAKNAKRSFASEYLKILFLKRSFASRFKLRYAQPFFAKLKCTINLPLYPQKLTGKKQGDALIFDELD